LIKADAFDTLFASFHEQLHALGYRLAGGQFVDATLVDAPRQRMTNDETQCAEHGFQIDDIVSGKSDEGSQSRTVC